MAEAAAVRMTRASLLERSSSTKELRVCDISGFIEAIVRVLNSVPYRWFTRLWRFWWFSRSQVSTIKLSKLLCRLSSLSSVRFSLWCLTPPSSPKRLSSTKANNRWKRYSGHSSASSFKIEKSVKLGDTLKQVRKFRSSEVIKFRELQVPNFQVPGNSSSEIPK